jgi:PAS domain S-box-containing protein
MLILISTLSWLLAIGWTFSFHHTLLLENTLPESARQSLLTFKQYLTGWMVFTLLSLLILAGRLIRRNVRVLSRPTVHLQSLATGQLPSPLPIEADEMAPLVQATNQLIENLRQASSFANSIGEGQLHVPFQPVSQEDALGTALVHMRERLLQVADEDKKRTWASEGLARFADLLQNSSYQEMSVLADRITAHLVRYLGANQGALFVLEESTHPAQLSLAACYAYDRKKFMNKRVQAGEGLVGQCYLEKESIYLTDVPTDYVHITSGLGEATPRCLLLVPLKMNEAIEGVFELASFHRLESYQIEFVEKVAESIASTLASSKVAERTRHLLEESQMRTEQMQAQEEEMRQHMEELKATQEEMSRKERAHLEEIERLEQLYHTNTAQLQKKDVEMTGIFKAINTTLATIEFDMQGLILTANQPFLDLMHTSLPEITGRHHRQFVDPQYAASSAYDDFWHSLQRGEAQTDDFRRIRKDGSEVWMRASYTPVRDQNGHIFKVIKLAQDITERKMAEIGFHTLSLVADNTDNSVVITDPEGLIEYVNPGFTRMTGYTLEESVGRKPGSFLQGPDTNRQTVERIRKKIQAQEPFYEEILNYDKSGLSYWISLAINPVFDSEGRVSKYISIQTNVTDTKRRALDYTSQMEAISRASAIVEFDLEGHVLTANENFLQLMEYRLDQVQGQHHRLFVEEAEQQSEAYLSFWKKLGKGEFFSGEFRRRTQSGKEVWLRGHYNAILDINGKPYKVVKYAMDITLQKELELKAHAQSEILKNQEEEMKSNLEQLEATREVADIKSRELEARMMAINSTLATIEFDLQGRILSANENFLRIMGYRAEELQNQPHHLLVDDDYAQSEEYRHFWQELRSGKAQVAQVKRRSKQGQVVWLNASYTPVMDRWGQPVKIIKLAQRMEK